MNLGVNGPTSSASPVGSPFGSPADSPAESPEGSIAPSDSDIPSGIEHCEVAFYNRLNKKQLNVYLNVFIVTFLVLT